MRCMRFPDVASAALAHRWWKRGELATYLGGHERLTAALAEAVDLTENSLRAREADEIDRAKRKAERQQKGRRR